MLVDEMYTSVSIFLFKCRFPLVLPQSYSMTNVGKKESSVLFLRCLVRPLLNCQSYVFVKLGVSLN